jgi:hypothetical protein
MAKHSSYTSKYDNQGKDVEDDPVVEATEVPPPGTEPHGTPAGLPPEEYMTAQEKHVHDGGEYAPPPESEADAAARRLKAEQEVATKQE